MQTEWINCVVAAVLYFCMVLILSFLPKLVAKLGYFTYEAEQTVIIWYHLFVNFYVVVILPSISGVLADI